MSRHLYVAPLKPTYRHRSLWRRFKRGTKQVLRQWYHEIEEMFY